MERCHTPFRQPTPEYSVDRPDSTLHRTLKPNLYVRDLLFRMRSVCAEFHVDVPDFTEAAELSPQEFRELGMSLANQL